MYMYMKLDIESLMIDLANHLSNVADDILADMGMEIQQGINWNRTTIQDDFKLINAFYDSSVQRVRGVLAVGAKTVIESFGTGTEMDLDNPALSSYYGGKFWNPARTEDTIVGRPAGAYINVFGQTVTSSGQLEGQPLLQSGIEPSYNIQNVEKKWFKMGLVEKRVSTEMKNFLSQNMSKYFTNANG